MLRAVAMPYSGGSRWAMRKMRVLKTSIFCGAPRISSISKDSSARIVLRMATTRMVGARIGTTTRRRVPTLLAPEVRDASSSDESRLRKAGTRRMTPTAMVPLSRCAATMPHHV